MGLPSTIFELPADGGDDQVAVSGLERPDLDYCGLHDLDQRDRAEPFIAILWSG